MLSKFNMNIFIYVYCMSIVKLFFPIKRAMNAEIIIIIACVNLYILYNELLLCRVPYRYYA